MLNGILNNALDFKNLTNNILNFTDVNLRSTIEQCVTIHSKYAFDKKISIEVDIPETMPKMRADELKIKRIFVGLLSRAVKFSPMHEKIRITGSIENIGSETFVKIVLKDNGFWLSEKGKQSLDLIEKSDDLDMEFSVIENLVHMHRGSCTMDRKPSKGTSITLLFPLFQPDRKNGILAHNVVPFGSE